MRLSAAARDAACAGLVGALDAAERPGYLEVRSGAMPSSVAEEPGGEVLARLSLGKPAFSAPVDGVARARIAPTFAVGTGDAAWFRAYDGAGSAVSDGDAGELQINVGWFQPGVRVDIGEWIVEIPEA